MPKGGQAAKSTASLTKKQLISLVEQLTKEKQKMVEDNNKRSATEACVVEEEEEPTNKRTKTNEESLNQPSVTPTQEAAPKPDALISFGGLETLLKSLPSSLADWRGAFDPSLHPHSCDCPGQSPCAFAEPPWFPHGPLRFPRSCDGGDHHHMRVASQPPLGYWGGPAAVFRSLPCSAVPECGLCKVPSRFRNSAFIQIPPCFSFPTYPLL